MRKTTVMALALPLAACACGPKAKPDIPVRTQRPTTPTVHKRVAMADMKFSADTEDQVVRMLWARPGTWTRISTQAPAPRDAAMVARDRAGARMVTLLPGAGYSVNRITLDCAKGRLGPIDRRDAAKDASPPDIARRLPGDAPFVLPAEIQKVCHAAPAGARTPEQQVAVAALALRRVDRRGDANDKDRIAKAHDMMRRGAAPGTPIRQMNQAQAPAGQAPDPRTAPRH